MPSLRSHNQPARFRTGRVSRPAPACTATGVGRAPGHKESLLTLLSAVESAPTLELAYVLELSGPYTADLLSELELEGRVESFKIGKVKHWQLP